MDIYEAIGRRRDVRREFNGEVIADDALMRILGAGHAAPSVGLSQPWDFHVVRRPERLRAFAEHVAGCGTTSRIRFPTIVATRSTPSASKASWSPAPASW